MNGGAELLVRNSHNKIKAEKGGRMFTDIRYSGQTSRRQLSMKTSSLEERHIKESVDIKKTFSLEETYTRRQGGLPRRPYRLAFFKSN